ncbi:TPA: FAD-NAD(P)-binding protein [Citrobacter freundii]
MRKIAIVGAGPTGIYTFHSLVKNAVPLAISVYERGSEAGVGMPYSDEENSRMMLANIASIEIPPIFSTYLDWLRTQSEEHLARYGVEYASLHNRQFLPRILLGEYFRDQFLALVELARSQGFQIEVHESCEVTDLEATEEGVRLRTGEDGAEAFFDLAVIATGHVWPDEDTTPRCFFPSPWSGLMEAKIPACEVGVMGTSLSAIDATMAIVVQHGEFTEFTGEQMAFRLDKGSEKLKIVLMSRTGILPEADFYCPIPYEPLTVLTPDVIATEIAVGPENLLDRVFKLIVQELELADPQWSQTIALHTLDADTFSAAWFAERKKDDPFHWARTNLKEVEHNKRDKRTVPWRYAILRLHEAVQQFVPFFTQEDRKRFDTGLARIFIDNYAAVPSQSIRRLLALHEAGIISILTLGEEYGIEVDERGTTITVGTEHHHFPVFIDARGQRSLKIKDLPFPGLRRQLAMTGEEIPDVGDDYTLQAPECVRGRIAFGALPWLMHDHPFVQGLTACAEIGAAMARAVSRPASYARRRLPFVDI